MIGAKKIKPLTMILALGGLSLAHAELKPLNAFYPIVCGEETHNRIYSTKVCFNKVIGANLEVASIAKLENGRAIGSSYYLVVESRDLPPASSDGLAQVLVPARRIKKLEPLEVLTAEEGQGYARIKSVNFTQSVSGRDELGIERSLDKRKELILSEDSTDTPEIRKGDAGLSLKLGANWEAGKVIHIDILRNMAATRAVER